MAHLIESTDNVISAHNIDMWHKLGEVKDVATIDDARRVLGYHVTLEPTVSLAGEALDDACITTCNRNGQRIILGTRLSSGYSVLQNEYLIQQAEKLLDQGLDIETLGTLENGKRAWIQLSFTDSVVLGSNDQFNKMILLSNDHAGRQASKVSFVFTRVVCNNTINAAKGSGRAHVIRVYHKGNVAQNFDSVVNLIDTANQQFLTTAETLEVLTHKNINSGDLREFVKAVYFPGSKEIKNEDQKRLEKLQDTIERAFETCPGHDLDTAKDTMFGAYQALNYHLNYGVSGGDEKRLTSLIWGNNAMIDQRALAVAASMV